jgi:hypothetical protein
MTRRRRKHDTWLTEEIDRARLRRMDEDASIATLSLGELPGWMRTRWARAKMTGRHAWLDAAALPPLYSASGRRLPVDATVATLRVLTHTTTTSEHDAVALLRDYLLPVSCARLVDALLVRWTLAATGDPNAFDPDLPPGQDVRPLHPTQLLAMRWVPQAHRLFHDRHSVEHVVSLLTYGVLTSTDASLPRWRRLAFPPDPQALLFTLRHAGDFGAATLRVLSYADGHLGGTAREAARLVNPHQRHHWNHLWHDPGEVGGLDVMSFPEQLDAIAALGFADGARAVTAADGSRRWVGVDLFEALTDTTDHPIPPDLPRESILAAVAIFRYLFAQTTAQLELHRHGQHSWDALEWSALFLDHPYMTFWARRILWSIADSPHTFRVCDDLTLADSDDDAFSLPPSARVHVADAQAISSPELARWSEVFADYEIVNPTEQFE